MFAQRFGWLIVLFLSGWLVVGCGGDEDTSTNPDGDQDVDLEDALDGDDPDGDEPDGDLDGDTDAVEGPMPDESLTPPPLPSDELGFVLPEREALGENPTQQEITDFTKKVTAFFKDTNYFDWVWRTSHGLDKSYDADMMDYKMWWQDCGMRKEGDTIVFTHTGRAENILKRTVKVMISAASGYQLTGDERMAEVATQLMKGIVALSLGMEFESEDPIVKYLQARAIFNHNHSYTVDDRSVSVDYTPMYWDETHERWYKWNVHVFEIPDNPTYGQIWISNMRSKDDVPYVFMSLPTVTRVFHETDNAELRAAAELYLEYMRGFSQSIVDSDWYILTKYNDGRTDIALDYTIGDTLEEHTPADLGSFVHWEIVYGPEAECNAQLGAAMTGYGFPAGKGDCGGGSLGTPGWSLEKSAFAGNWFNYNIYNYFHIGALASSHTWGYTDITSSLMDGLVARFEEIRTNPNMPNNDHHEFASDKAGWLISAATHGYPLTAQEARHIMQWYGESSDWYRPWPHWDPWASMADGEEFSDYKAPRDEWVDDGQGGTMEKTYVRLVEMPYIFEYCNSPLRDTGVQFIDCDIVADPTQWGEE